MNGLLFDCSRLLEPLGYYRRLIAFMAEWGMDTLVLHFADDYGCALRLPGFEELAMPGAFTSDELQELIGFARDRGIEVIPEIEAFGHTRYITDHPRYRHLYAGRWTRNLRFNAIDPLHPETHRLMRRLIAVVAEAFPSRYLHLGCDEVNMEDYCRQKGLAVDAVWTRYVNGLIELAHKAGKTPMIWADHVAGKEEIARRLRKDVVLVDWRYDPDIEDDVIPRLKQAGFRDLVAAPSVACWRHRFLPTAEALENTARMALYAARHDILGVITTVWCPWRYLQNAMYYGIAYSARAAAAGGRPDPEEFNRDFARRVFGTDLTPALAAFLADWPELAIDRILAQKIARRRPAFTCEEIGRLRAVNRLGRRVLRAVEGYVPRANPDIWGGMVLAACCAWLCSEGMLLRLLSSPARTRKDRYNRLLAGARREMDAEWDRTR
ncbi:MAG: family 20 glycosylhydrolase, partial [Patescibacteria group bacterium]